MRSAEEINPIFNKLLALNTVGHSHTHAWLHFLSVIVTLVVIGPSVVSVKDTSPTDLVIDTRI